MFPRSQTWRSAGRLYHLTAGLSVLFWLFAVLYWVAAEVSACVRTSVSPLSQRLLCTDIIIRQAVIALVDQGGKSSEDVSSEDFYSQSGSETRVITQEAKTASRRFLSSTARFNLMLWIIGFLLSNVIEDCFRFVAMLFAPAALIAPLLGLNIGVTLILARVWQKEKISKKMWACKSINQANQNPNPNALARPPTRPYRHLLQSSGDCSLGLLLRERK